MSGSLYKNQDFIDLEASRPTSFSTDAGYSVSRMATHDFGYADVVPRLISYHQKPEEEEAVIAAVGIKKMSVPASMILSNICQSPTRCSSSPHSAQGIFFFSLKVPGQRASRFHRSSVIVIPYTVIDGGLIHYGRPDRGYNVPSKTNPLVNTLRTFCHITGKSSCSWNRILADDE